MLPWHRSIATAMPPATPMAALARIWLRQRATLAAASAVAITLALGWYVPGAPAPGMASIARTLESAQLAALSAIVGAGLLAWHLARLAASPRTGGVAAALPAALMTLATMPHLAWTALLVPALLLLVTALRSPRERVVALMVQCGALAVAPLLAVNHATSLGVSAAIVIYAGISVSWGRRVAANDNPGLTRAFTNSKLLPGR